MKVFVVLFLIYVGYRLIIPKPEIRIEDKKWHKITEEEYTDYEEIDD